MAAEGSGNTSREASPHLGPSQFGPPGGSNYPDPIQLGYGVPPAGQGSSGESSSSARAQNKGKGRGILSNDRVTRHGGCRTQRRADFRNLDGSLNTIGNGNAADTESDDGGG